MTGLTIIWWLVPAALLLGLGFLFGFIWAAKAGQYDDLETPAVRILFDESRIETKEKKNGIHDKV